MRLLLSVCKRYGSFARQEVRTVLFGLIFSFMSSFGQTFWISLFVPGLLEAFDLSRTGFGSIYSAITLCSAVLIPVLGGLIDRVPLYYYSITVLVSLVVGTLLTSIAPFLVGFIVGLFLMRLSGQGLSSHISKTAVARYYGSNRGKALSIVNLGLAIGEGILPALTTGLIGYLGWRGTLSSAGILVLIILLPLQVYLLTVSGLGSEHSPGESDTDDQNGFLVGWEIYWNRLTELRFWLILPAVLLPAFWITGLFLYQSSLAAELDWSMQLLATAFISYASVRIACSLGVGPLIDRFSARVLFPFYIVPFGLGLVVACVNPGRWASFLYMGLLGMTMGISGSIKTALWAELYGTGVLGSVRSMFASLMVFSTSLSPFLMGWMLDMGIEMKTILWVAVLTVVLSILGAWLGLSSKISSASCDQ